MKDTNAKEYGKIVLMTLLGGIAGTLPYLLVNFFWGTVVGPLYLLTGFSAYSFYLYFTDFRNRNKLYPLFSQIGLFLSVILTTVVFFSFDPEFTKQAAGTFYQRAYKIVINNYRNILLAIALYYVIAIIGEFATYLVFKLLKIKPVYEERKKKNVRKKF